MTDNEIIKALKCCKEGTAIGCKNCPLYEDKGHTCITILSHNALDLINRQKAEIDILIRKKETLRDDICELQAENEMIKKEISELERLFVKEC